MKHAVSLISLNLFTVSILCQRGRFGIVLPLHGCFAAQSPHLSLRLVNARTYRYIHMGFDALLSIGLTSDLGSEKKLPK